MSERRNSGRVRTLLKGRILFANRQLSMDCVIRDISSTGARLVLSENAVLPDVFTLEVPQRQRSYTCNLRWRRVDDVGIRFVLPRVKDGEMSFSQIRAYIRSLESENEELRRRVDSDEPADLAG